MYYGTLNLDELADEWLYAIDVLDDPVEYTEAELEDEREVVARVSELANDLGLDPDPEDLRRFDEMLILESDFESYAEELANDIGAIDLDAGWPASYIDWERAARDLSMDYTSVSYDGQDYLYRAS